MSDVWIELQLEDFRKSLIAWAEHIAEINRLGTEIDNKP